jgi:hypothetical protein
MAIEKEKRFEAEGLSPRTTELWRELDLIMTFHERVEARFALLFGVNAALLATLANAAPPPHQLGWIRATLIVVTIATLATSIAHIYRGLFPNLRGPMNSLIYFRSVAAYMVDDYVREWQGISATQLLDDLARQVWQNSRVVTAKFRRLKAAFAFTVGALVPWAIALEVMTWGESTAKSLIGR